MLFHSTIEILTCTSGLGFRATTVYSDLLCWKLTVKVPAGNRTASDSDGHSRVMREVLTVIQGAVPQSVRQKAKKPSAVSHCCIGIDDSSPCKDGNFLQDLLIDEGVAAVDALSRAAALRHMHSCRLSVLGPWASGSGV